MSTVAKTARLHQRIEGLKYDEAFGVHAYLVGWLSGCVSDEVWDAAVEAAVADHARTAARRGAS